MPSSRGTSQSRDWTQTSDTAVRFFTVWAIRYLAKEICKTFTNSFIWMLTTTFKSLQHMLQLSRLTCPFSDLFHLPKSDLANRSLHILTVRMQWTVFAYVCMTAPKCGAHVHTGACIEMTTCSPPCSSVPWSGEPLCNWGNTHRNDIPLMTRNHGEISDGSTQRARSGTWGSTNGADLYTTVN